ncbi:hypothetical protein A3860_03955 [Niastella vici]|uniref:Secretion system C-terminal sorting domain-containing protein n=1 Tax=Niastella vici TaxID=1703345 RepID=A0A1V9FRI3_9BACT|nr:T9SS type A sorting domain-containing protein [Niastella vici]OQP60891.1 hypothetical protein A3860_03955 [Niastella vici]
MNLKFYPLRAALFALLLLGFKARTQAQVSLDFQKAVENITTGGDGTSAKVGEILQYTITVTNKTAQNYVATKLYDNVPAGTTYITGSTTLNGAAVADASGGKMPYAGSGGYIKSPTFGAGILAPNITATIIFQVKVTANGGSVFNNATVDASQNSVSTVQATNTVTTNITVDAPCNNIYQTTPSTTTGCSWPCTTSYNYIRNVNNSTSSNYGKATTLYYNAGGTQKDAFTGSTIGGASILSSSAAIAYDGTRKWLFFINNSGGEDLSYVNLSTSSPYTAYRFTGYQVETNTNNGYNVNRLGMGSDGYLYGLTSNALDFIRIGFKDSSGLVTPVITRYGALTNAATNGTRDVFADAGGDLFADGNGKLYLIANSGNMYKINPSTRVATYMGTVNPYPGGASQALAIDAYGTVYIGGAYTDVYTLNLSTMATTRFNAAGASNVYYSGDFASCGFPVLTSSIIATKSYKNIDGTSVVNGGDTVEYSITVTNYGNINAAGVYMYDYIPPATTYVTHTTKINDSLIPDASGGIMPYAVSGGKLVMTKGEDPGIIKPGVANAAVVKFRVATLPNVQVCNQSKITLLDADGNVMFVNSNDPTNVGQTPTCFYSDGILPLSNLKFKGSLVDDRSLLTWSMNGDENVATYEVEFSETGTKFTTTGTVAGKGSPNSSANTYQFTDAQHTFASIRYYRLKAIQKGGNYTYSGIIKLNAQDLDIEAAPNPFDRDLNVQVRLKTAETVRIRLLDLLGKEVYSTTEKLGIGTNSLSIRIPAGLTKGIYLLDVKAGNEQIFQKKLLKK